jgi:hypothetical protein
LLDQRIAQRQRETSGNDGADGDFQIVGLGHGDCNFDSNCQ